MPQVSKNKVNKKFQKKLDDLLFESFSYLSPYSTEDFIDDLFTPTEKIMIAKRIAIVHLIYQGYSYRHISHILKVSTTTINRIKHSLISKGDGYKKIISSINKKHSTLKFIEKIVADVFVRKYPSKNLPQPK